MSSGKENSAFALLLLIVLVAVTADAFSYYSSHLPATQGRSLIEGLQVQSTSVDVTDLSGTGLSLNLNAVVYNPNDFGVTLDAVNYSIYGSGRYLGNGQTAREYSLDPHSSQTLTFPVSVSWRPIFQTMGNYVVEWGNVTWEVNGTANIKVAGLPLSVPFKFTTG